MNIQQTQHLSDYPPKQIAIVGLGCRYPGAKNPQELWENIIARRRQFRRMPDVRLPLDDYQSDDKSILDKTYGTRAAVIDGYEFEWAKHRIPKKTAETTDIAHWLTLDVVLQMLEDAGYTADDLPRSKTQVIIGNTLTGEFTRSNMLRLRWPFIQKILRQNARQLAVTSNQFELFSKNVEEQFKSISPTTNEDSLAGGLANTIAGRVCNYLNLHGGGFTVDGACSSSLISVYTAATHLANHSIDFAIAGGVDISLDPFELIGFAKTGALTQGDMTVYDKRGSGFIPGEGCGIVGMKRLEDAQRDGDKIYAVVDGWGMSSDGKGGITAPTVHGQSMALGRAYQQAGIDTADLDFIEGHGTGTKVGDRVELLAIADAIKNGGDIQGRRCGVTSFKSIVGHTKAAAGIGAFIKTVISVNQRVIPPTAGCQDPHDVFSSESDCLYPVMRGEVKPSGYDLRAGVSAMGFGGINLHLTLSSGVSAGVKKQAHFTPAIGERAALVSNQDSEVFCLSAMTVESLSSLACELQENAKDISLAELADFAATNNSQSNRQAVYKVAIVARSPNELVQRLKQLLAKLTEARTNTSVLNNLMVDPIDGFLLSINKMDCKLAWVFPGQGSQRANMSRVLVERFDWARTLVGQADTWAAEVGTLGLKEALFSLDDTMVTKEECQPAIDSLRETRLAQPVITLISLLWATYLRRLGLSPKAVMGHSLGELSAFYAAGAFDQKTLIQLAALRGQLMTAKSDQAAGTMLSVAASGDAVDEMIAAIKKDSSHSASTLVIANLNSAMETIASGSVAAIEALEQLANEKGLRAKRLRVSNAFHSPLVAEASQKLRASAPLNPLPEPLTSHIISSCDGQLVGGNTNLPDYFSEQISRQVNFISASQTLQQHCDLVFEVGPGAVLSKLISKNQTRLITQSVESQAESFYDMNQVLALAFIHGQPLRWDEVYSQRLIKPFISPSQRVFLTNPCERLVFDREDKLDDDTAAFSDSVISRSLAKPLSHDIEETRFSQRASDQSDLSQAQPSFPGEDNHQQVLAMVADFTGFEQASITLDANILDDLNLDSIKSAELVGRLATLFNAQDKIDPADYATSSLLEVVNAMSAAGGENVYIQREDTKPVIPDQTVSATRTSEGIERAESVKNVENKVATIVADFTGFEAESITLEANLLDDLNLDSIKSAELVGRIATQFDRNDKIDPGNYATATLAQVVSDMHLGAPLPQATSQMLEAPAQGAIGQEIASQSIAQQVATLVADFTGFEAASISLEANLLDDLNLDSIKSAELVGRIAGHYQAQDKVDPGNYATATLQQVVTDLKLGGSSQPTITDDQPVATVDQSQAEPPIKQHHQDGQPAIQQFWMQAVRNNLSANVLATPELNGAYFGISAEEKTPALDCLASKLQAHGARIKWLIGNALVGNSLDEEPDNLDGMIVFLSQTSTNLFSGHGIDQAILQQCIERLHTTALLAIKQQPKWGVTFVQFGGNSLTVDLNSESISGSNTSLAAGNIKTASTSAFAATLHLENESLKVGTIDFNNTIAPQFIADNIVAELANDERYFYTHYDQHVNRYTFVPREIDVAQQAPRSIVWNRDDVVLVTGGGKGITAECAFAFAKSTGVKMVLLGSSPANTEVEQTLLRYQQAGLLARYEQCNITDASAVRHCIANIENSLGAITGLIHGAGLNKAKRFEQTKIIDAVSEVSPKLLGISHLCSALAHRPPKMIAGFSSIIGVTGMPGNAWYAFSNEALNLTLQQFAALYPQTQIVCLAYSVWGEVGMGARMGSVKRLSSLGISAIPSKTGVDYFMCALSQEQPAHQVVITGSLGGLDTWRPETILSSQAPTPVDVNNSKGGQVSNITESNLGWRFLQNIIAFTPRKNITVRTTLNLQDDLYLLDHNYRGTYLFPTVFGLEAMAQAVARLLSLSELPPLQIIDINLSRPIAVGSATDKKGTTEIQIKAELDTTDGASSIAAIKVGISTEQSGFTRDHFSATFLLSTPAVSNEDIRKLLPENPLDIEPLTELYGGLLFQGKLFQRLQKVWSMSTQGAMASIEVDQAPRYYSDTYRNEFLLGDPACRDVLLQSAQLAVKGILLPIGIERIDWFGQRNLRAVLANTQVLSRTHDAMSCQVSAVDENSGQMLERMSAYHLKQMEYDEQDPQPEDWAIPEKRDQKILDEQLLQSSHAFGVTLPLYQLNYSPQFHQLKREQRHPYQVPVLSQLVQPLLSVPTLPSQSNSLDDQLLTIEWNNDGKPLVKTRGRNPNISLSHDSRHCLYVAGLGKQGCDLEAITQRSYNTWLSLFASQHHASLDQLMTKGDTLDEAGTRLWSALESLKKAGAQKIDLNAIDIKAETDAVLMTFTVDGASVSVLTLALSLTRPPRKMLAMIVTSSAGDYQHSPAQESVPAVFTDNMSLQKLNTFENTLCSNIREEQHSGEPILCFRFMVTFKETTTAANTVNFDTYADWMGTIRERAIVTVADEMVPDFISGQWGMVTNHSHVDIFQPVKCMEVIEARLRILRAYGQYNSSVDMQFDWVKVKADGSEVLVARSYMATTWVEIIGHGQVKVQPFPDYMQTLITDYLPKNNSNKIVLQERQGHQGDCLFQSANTPQMLNKLLTKQFETTSSESNLVGNIYYANYYHWQSRVIDTFFHRLQKEVDIPSLNKGRFNCIHSKVSHLREAMPYDVIEVALAIKAIYRDGLKFHLEVYRVDKTGQKMKLTTIEHDSVWLSEGNTLSDIPQSYLDYLLDRARGDHKLQVVDHLTSEFA